MPKLIENLHEKLINQSRAMLLARGYDHLNIREVADECQVAVGTVYNYFPSKEAMVGAVMMEDWNAALARAREKAASAPDVVTGLMAFKRELKTYVDTYMDIWVAYHANVASVLMARHDKLTAQMLKIIEPLLARFDRNTLPAMPLFAAKAILSAAIYNDINDEELRAVLGKLLQ